MTRERIRLENEATEATQERLLAETAARDAAQSQLAAEQEARAAAEELLAVETERTQALQAAAAAARRKIAYKRSRIKAAHDRARAHDEAVGRAAIESSEQEEIPYLPESARVAVSALSGVEQTMQDHDSEFAEAEEQEWAAFTNDEVPVEEPDAEASVMAARNERIAGEIALESALPEQMDADDDHLDEQTRRRIADFTRPTFAEDRFGHAPGTGHMPLRRSYRGALAGGVTVAAAAAAVVSWIFVGWTSYPGSAEARRAEPLKPVSIAPAKTREVTPPLSTLDLPTLSLRMRLADPVQPQDGAVADSVQKN
jgi:hypothetical protein